MRPPATRLLAPFLACLACTIGLAACSSGDDERPTGAGRSSRSAGSTATEDAAPRPQVRTVTGNLAAGGRDALAEAVGTVVDGWLDGAYLGDFPRSDYSAAFADFTPGAAARARRDLALMTNAGISGRIQRAAATGRSVALDVLAVGNRPVGVTATVDLAFETTGALAGPQEVTGTLDLAPGAKGWKVFGFDITRTPARPSAAAGSGS